MMLLRRLQLLSLLSSLLASSAAVISSLPAATASARAVGSGSWSSGKHHSSNGFLPVDDTTALLPRRRGITRLFRPHTNSGRGAALSSPSPPNSATPISSASGVDNDELAHINPDSLKPTAGSNMYQIGDKSSSFVSLTDHGGRVMSGSVPLYLIYYGNWAGDNGQGIMEAFINSINNTAADSKGVSVREWFYLHTRYRPSSNGGAATNIYLAGTRTVTSSSNLPSDSSVANVVRNLQSSGSLPYDSNALFAVLTSSGIQQDGFCRSYCGWHNSFAARTGSTSVNVMFVGWGGDCNGGCTPSSNSINGNYAMDGMVSVMAHEITESVTDVGLDAFWDSSSGQENADACAWHFLKLPSSNEPYYNTYGINGYKFLLQANIDPSTNDCVHGLESSAPAAPPPPAAQCSASSSNGRKCTCPTGKSSKDGCVCSNKSCVAYCSVNLGRRCRACNRFFCLCKSATCTAVFA